MNRLSDFELADIDVDDFRQIPRQRAHFDFEQHVFQDATAGFDASGFPDGFHRDGDRHLFILGNFMKIHVKDFAAQRMVLHFLDQRQPPALGAAFERQIHQDGFGDGTVNQVFNLVQTDFEVLWSRPAAIDDCGNPPVGAQFFDAGPFGQRARRSRQRYRFHGATIGVGAAQLVRPPLNSNSEVTEELLWIRLIASPNKLATESVVTFTPLIGGRRTVSVVISSSMMDFFSR